jgi:hypothetical protein
MRNPLFALLALATLLALPGIARAEAATTPDRERWFVLQIDGQRAGWMVERRITTDTGNIREDTEISMAIARMGQTIEIAIKSGTLESAAGALLEMRSLQTLGASTTKSAYTFHPDHILQTTDQLGRTTEKKLPLPAGDWLTPAQVRALVARKLAEGATEFSYTTIDGSSGIQLAANTHRVVGRRTVEAFGKSVPAIEWSITTSILPGVETREFVDESGDMVRSEIDFGGISMAVLLSERELALAKLDAPELMAAVLVKPSRPIPDPRSVRRAQYTIRFLGEGAAHIPSLGAQRFERIDDASGTLTVDLDNPLPATDAEVNDPRHLAASNAADTNDPDLRALLDSSIANIRFTDQRALAEHLTRAVRDHITDKSLGVGFATASEVCRTREGDCSEHGVLLAALLRAAGIPSRVVSGLVYVDQFVGEREVFGFHMWTQALLTVDGVPTWIDLDAAVYPMDATHIALATSTLSDTDVINSMVPIADAMGRLAIDVVSINAPAPVPSTP